MRRRHAHRPGRGRGGGAHGERRGWSEASRRRLGGGAGKGAAPSAFRAALGDDEHRDAGRAGGDGGAGEVRERIATIAVTLRAFARASGAEAAMLLLDRGESGQPFVVECPADGPVVLAEGEQAVELDPDRLAADPLELPALPAPPATCFGPESLRPALAASASASPSASTAASPPQAAGDAPPARVDAAALAHAAALASAMRALVALFPGRSVLTATFPTADEETPFHLAVRSGDPIVAALGRQQYELPAGWPA